MYRFQVWWLKFCCFLTGYNFYILSNCSEVSVRKTKKYTAAILIVAIVWAFVGYSFCERYIKLDVVGSIVGALTSMFIVVQIERQILLAYKVNKYLKLTRFALAMLMAIVGSLIIDQIIFKDDIEKNKMSANQEQVNKLMPGRTKEVNNQIIELNNALAVKELERKILIDDINKNPTKQIVETTSDQVPVTNTVTDSAKKSIVSTILKNRTSKRISIIANPKIGQLQPIDNQISAINKQKTDKDSILLSLRSILEKEVNDKVGFLDELKVMIGIFEQSTIALVVYMIWFFFLLILELLILIGKANDVDSDYDFTIQKQMNLHLKKIDLL